MGLVQHQSLEPLKKIDLTGFLLMPTEVMFRLLRLDVDGLPGRGRGMVS
jgi:hypothetical protein